MTDVHQSQSLSEQIAKAFSDFTQEYGVSLVRSPSEVVYEKRKWYMYVEVGNKDGSSVIVLFDMSKTTGQLNVSEFSEKGMAILGSLFPEHLYTQCSGFGPMHLPLIEAKGSYFVRKEEPPRLPPIPEVAH